MPPSGRGRGRPRGGGRGGRGAGRGGRGAAAGTTAAPESSAAEAAPPAASSVEHVTASDAKEAPAPAAGTPASASTTSTSTTATIRAGRGGARGGAAAVASAGASKFRPRAVRRGDVERERIAQEELRKQNLKVAEDQRLQRARFGRGGGGRRARGRGDAMGRGGGFDRRVVAGGNSTFVNVGAVSSGYGSGQGSFKTGYRDQSNRLNADMFNGPAQDFDDDDDDDEHKDGSGSTPRANYKRRDVMPMGITRREPKKKELVVTTSADMVAKEQAAAAGEGVATRETSSSGAAASSFEDVVMKDDGQVWPGAPTERKVKVRGANGEEIEVTEIDDRRIQQRARSATTKDEDGDYDDKAKAEAKEKYQSREDEVRADQLAMMLRELGPRADGDSKDGRLYLFQLPPIMPPLRVVQRPDKKAKQKSVVKDEPVDEDGGVVTMDVGQTFDLTEGAGTGNGTNENEDDDDESSPYPDTVGYVGEMKVRRSGKVTMDWGGIAYSVMPGIQTSFLTNAVLLEEADKKPRSGEIAGRAYGMGKVMGRFVCRPVFKEPVPWVVDPADLAEAKAEAEAKEEAKARALEEKARLAKT